MQNLVFRESGMPHRMPLSKRPPPVVAQGRAAGWRRS
jgi:hypothetical protein